MKDEAIGAIPADRANQTLTTDCSSGFRLVPEGVQMTAGFDLGDPSGDTGCILAVADEATPMTEDAWNWIVEEMRKPRFAFERTFDGHRYTRRIR